jgi:uncharacterized surface anchored protein
MKKVRILLILLALIIQMFVGTPLQVFAADVSSQIKTINSTFTIRDSENNVILPDINGIYSNIPRDSEIELYYSFEILDESESGPVVEYSYLAGDTVVVQLPSQLSYVVPVDGLDIVDTDSGLTMGVLTVASDGKATITFTDFVETHTGMQAWFRINGTFSEDTLGLPVNVPINLEFDGEIIQIGIQEPVLPDVTINMTKSGVYDKDTNEIVWTINVTSSGLIYNLDLIDTMSANHAFVLGSMTVGGVSVTPTAVGNAWTYVLSELNGTSTIIYRSKPVTNAFSLETVNATSTSFNNTTRAEKNDVEKASASASVTTNWIDKAGELDDDDRNLFHWTITVNSMDAPMTNAVIVDILPVGLEVVPGSFRLRLPNGTTVALTENAVLTPGFYTLEAGSEVGPLKSTIIRYVFDGAITEDHALEFDSRVIDPLVLSSNLSEDYINTATLSWDNGNLGSPTAGAEVGTLPGTIISKSVAGNNQNYNYITNNTSSWTVTLNSQGLNPIENASFEDTIPSGSEYVDGSFVVSYSINGSSVNIGTMSYDTVTRKLTYIFTNPITTTIYIRYQTRVTNLSLYERNANVDLVNDAIFIGDQIRDGRQTSTATRRTRSQMFAKNVVVPLYNYSTREITWRLVINRNQIPQSNVVVTDLVPAGLRLLPDSITVTAGEVYVLSTVVQNSGNISDRDSLRFEFASIDNQVIITYKTVAEEGLLLIDGNKSLTNSAVYSSSTIQNLTASATAAIQNRLVTKTGNYENGSDFIRWGVTINPNAVRLNEVQLVDDLQTGLQLDTTSVVLYEMELQADGALVQSPTALGSSNYSVSYDEPSNQFTFTFANPIDRPYRLEFVTDILVQNLSVQNSIRLSGVGQTYNSTASTISVEIAEDDLSGGGTGIKGSIRIRKGDKADSNISLAGAVFGLYNSAGIKLVELTTDEDGYATFSNLGMRTYTIVELSAPYGYSIDPTPIRVRLNSTVPNANTQQLNDMLTGTITLNKVLLDYKGDTLSSSDPFVITLTGPSYPSGQQFNVYAGVPLEVDNLLIGQYSVTEQNSESYDVTISGFADISFEDLDHTITITNQEARAAITVRKVVQYSNGAIDNRNQSFEITVKGPSYPSGANFAINNQTDLVLDGLLFGEYEIKELGAFAYTVTIDGNTELTEASRTTLVTITNRRRPDSVLPQTGLDPVLWPSILGGFLIFIGFITRKKKKTKVA